MWIDHCCLFVSRSWQKFSVFSFSLKLWLCLVNPAKKQPPHTNRGEKSTSWCYKNCVWLHHWNGKSILRLGALFLCRLALARIWCSRRASISTSCNISVLSLHKFDQRLLSSMVEGSRSHASPGLPYWDRADETLTLACLIWCTLAN